MKVKNVTKGQVDIMGISIQAGEEKVIDDDFIKIVKDQPALKIIETSVPEKKQKVKKNGTI